MPPLSLRQNFADSQLNNAAAGSFSTPWPSASALETLHFFYGWVGLLRSFYLRFVTVWVCTIPLKLLAPTLARYVSTHQYLLFTRQFLLFSLGPLTQWHNCDSGPLLQNQSNKKQLNATQQNSLRLNETQCNSHNSMKPKCDSCKSRNLVHTCQSIPTSLLLYISVYFLGFQDHQSSDSNLQWP